MVMNWVWVFFLSISILFSLEQGRGTALSGAILTGAQAGVTLAVSLSGSLCLWSGAGKLMAHLGITEALGHLLRPVLSRLFPSSRDNPPLAGAISGNFCANLLGLGNAATPMGLEAARRLKRPECPGYATDELCRLIVLNTASIQLIPSNVAAVRLSLGCQSPFDILPAVWVSSFLSAGLGLGMAALLGRVWKR